MAKEQEKNEKKGPLTGWPKRIADAEKKTKAIVVKAKKK